MIYRAIANMGNGKTLFCTLYALAYQSLYPENRIYGNYSLIGIKNYHYSPYMILPFSSLENCLLLYDDIASFGNYSKGILKIIACLSRKNNITVVLTGQYYSMIPKNIRTLSKDVLTYYNKSNDILSIGIANEIGDLEDKERGYPIRYYVYQTHDAVKIAKDFYDTKEKVPFTTEKHLIDEIIKASKNREDIEIALEIYIENSQKKSRYFKEIRQRPEWESLPDGTEDKEQFFN